MAGPAAPEVPKGKTVIKNVGLMLSGALETRCSTLIRWWR